MYTSFRVADLRIINSRKLFAKNTDPKMRGINLIVTIFPIFIILTAIDTRLIVSSVIGFTYNDFSIDLNWTWSRAARDGNRYY